MRDFLRLSGSTQLREMLLKMRNQIEDILTVFPEDVEETEDSYTLENSSAPSVSQPAEETHFRVKDIESTRKLSGEPEHAPEAVEAWQKIESRFTQPQIKRIEVELCPPETPVEMESCDSSREFMPLDLAEVPSEEEVRERIAVMVESGALDEESARELEQATDDTSVRAAFCKRYMTLLL